ncbi:MAG: rod shape-determining protein [Oscillospiraceae bacterium]
MLDIGIDLGTANIVMTTKRKGVVLNESTVVAYNKKRRCVMAIGNDADLMEGRSPDYINLIRPVADGVISDDIMTRVIVREFILKLSGKQLLRPRVIICIPSSITDVESKAVIEAALGAGARKVFLIQEPIAAMLGAGEDISKPEGRLVVDIGGGTTDIAVISLNGIVNSNSVKVAGNTFDASIMRYIFNRYKVQIGEKTAENIKMSLSNVYNPNGKRTMLIGGKNIVNGLPEQLRISELDVYYAIKDDVDDIINAIVPVLEKTPPELAGDISRKGALLTGGGALLGGLDMLIYKSTGIKCRVAKDALTCAAKGTSAAFNIIDNLLDGFEYISFAEYYR